MSTPKNTGGLLAKIAAIREAAEGITKMSGEMTSGVGFEVAGYGFEAQYAMALQNGGLSPQIAQGMASDLRHSFRKVAELAELVHETTVEVKCEADTLEHIVQAGKHRARAGGGMFGTAFQL
jgi:hypothetical protein